jgi:transposase-like protein
MKPPKTLQEAIRYFADYDNCRQFMVALRWPDGNVLCPTCGSAKVTYLEKARVYRCYGDHKRQKFSLKVGTVMEDSALGLDKWLPAIWMLVNCKNGVSSYEIHRALGITQKSAWFLLHRIRLAMKSGSMQKFGGNGGAVEADETFVGGNPQRMHKSRRLKIQAMISSTYGLNKYAAGKTTVHGMLDRDTREVRAKVIPNVKRATLQEQILNHVSPGATVYTDELPSYKYALANKFVHEVINHSQSYVSGQVHTNGIENFWSCLKRGLRGTYVAVEPFHLDRYVDEQVFRFNNRGNKKQPVDDAQRFTKALSQIVGKRLTYAEVTGKTEEADF